MSKRTRILGGLAAVPFLFSAPGCLEIRDALEGSLTEAFGLPAGPGGLEPTGDSAADSDDSIGSVPQVRLSVSNPTPQLNEAVGLTCSVVGGSSEAVTFDFQPAGRLIVNRAAGTATFIVLETDLGVAATFTCTGTNAEGTSPPSDSLVFIPTP